MIPRRLSLRPHIIPFHRRPSSSSHRCATNNNNFNNQNHLQYHTSQPKLQLRQFHNTRPPFQNEEAPFDRHAKWKQRARAAESSRQYYNNYIIQSELLLESQQHPEKELHRNNYNNDGNNLQHNNNRQSAVKKPTLPYDYFHKEVANRLVDRLDDICVREEGFPLALEIGAGAGFVHEAIISDVGLYGLDNEDDDLSSLLDEDENIATNREYVGGRGGIRKLVQMDSCSAMLHRDDVFSDNHDATSSGKHGGKEANVVCETYKLVAEEEDPLPFPDGTFDLVISSMAFHWINDLPRMLNQIKRVLKPDGCLLFALPGGNTLPELRSSIILAELERTGGVSTHVGPYMDISNVGSLLTGTGFRLPTIDVDEIQIGYPNMMVLMEHLGRMGEGNASVNRRERVGLGTFLGGACLYRELYPLEDEAVAGGGGEEEKGVVASAQIIYGIAWKEHESQQAPLERGSATHKMTDITVTKTPGS